MKDLLAFLRLAENPRDGVAAARVLMLIPGIGPKRAASLVQKLSAARHDFRAWKDYAAPVQGTEIWLPFVELMTALSTPDSRAGSIAAQVHRFLDRAGEWVERAAHDDETLEVMTARFASAWTQAIAQEAPGFGPAEMDLLALDIELNAQGLAFVANVKRASPPRA